MKALSILALYAVVLSMGYLIVKPMVSAQAASLADSAAKISDATHGR